MTHIDPAAPAVDPVHLVATHLDRVAMDALANGYTPSAKVLRIVAGELLDELLADDRTPPPAVERDADAVRLVADILADEVSTSPEDLARIASDVVGALLGIPTVTMHYDTGRIEVDWQDTPTHRPRACIVARDFVDDLVERLQPEPSDPVENHATPDDDAFLAELGDAIAEDLAAQHLTHAAPAIRAPRTLSPDCKAGKCTACNGDAWSDRLDAHTDCEHECHTR